MTLKNRIAAIEEKLKDESIDSIIVLDGNGNEIKGAEVVQMPTQEADGLARLPDGSTRSIIYEREWRHILVMLADEDEEVDEDSPCRIRPNGIVIFEMVD